MSFAGTPQSKVKGKISLFTSESSTITGPVPIVTFDKTLQLDPIHIVSLVVISPKLYP